MTRASAPAAMKMSKPPAKTKGEPNKEANWLPPLQPRRGLFIVLLSVFALWVGVLLWMYFTKTTHPSAPPPRQAPAVARMADRPADPFAS